MNYDFDTALAQKEVDDLIDRLGERGAERVINRRFSADVDHSRVGVAEIQAALNGAGYP